MIDNIFLKDNNYEIVNYNETNRFDIYIKSKKTSCKCPKCGDESNEHHSTYTRKLQDTPIHNIETWLHVTAYEFECTNKKCDVTTFVEELSFARKNKVKTDALVQFILSISIFLSSTSASLILSFLGVKVSADSIDDIIKNIKIIDNPNVETVGIDDVAIRKGQTYATAIYDLKDHHLIALLDGRDAESIKEFLINHKKIKVVARDRASAYASAISEVLPNCIQVADRFHLFENLIRYLKDLFYSELPEKIFIKDNEIKEENEIEKVRVSYEIDEKELSKLDYDNSLPIDVNGQVIVFDNKRHQLDSKQYLKQAENRILKMEMVKKLRERLNSSNCHNTKEIAKEFNISQSSLRKYKKMTDKEVDQLANRRDYKKRKTVIDDYINIIYKMIIDNISPEYIIEYVIRKGYQGNIRNIEIYIELLTKNNNLNYDYSSLIFVKYEYPKDVIIITRYELFKYLLTKDEKKKNNIIEKYLDIIKNKYTIVKEVRDIFENFHETIFSKDENKIDLFIEKYQEKLKSFCNGLKKDIAAVKQAISNSINSGFVEGNNNKFKLIKRIVYGKMKLCNLFKKSYLCFLSTTDNFNILDIVEGVLQDDKK